MDIGKSCKSCGEWKLADEYHKQKGQRLGRRPQCKACRAASPDPRKTTEVVTVEGRECTDCGHWKSREYFYKSKHQQYGLSPRCIECLKLYRSSPEYKAWMAAYLREYVQANPEKARARKREHRESNRERYRFLASQYQHRKRANGGEPFTREEWLELCEGYGNVCLCCGSDDSLEMDHVIPLSKGGKHELANVAPLCRSCNASKNAKIIDYRTANE